MRTLIISIFIVARLVDTGFTSCTKTCGGGRQLRMIKINRREYLQTRRCNPHPCPSKYDFVALDYVVQYIILFNN